MPSPSELQRTFDEHGLPNRSGVVFEKEHPAERAAREYHEHVTISTPEEARLRQRVQELEQTLALKDGLIVSQGERITAQAELLSRKAGKQ